MTKMNFAFSYHFKEQGHSFTGEPLPTEAKRIKRMIIQLQLFARQKNLQKGSIFVDFDHDDSPSIMFYDSLPVGYYDDIADVIYNKSTI